MFVYALVVRIIRLDYEVRVRALGSGAGLRFQLVLRRVTCTGRANAATEGKQIISFVRGQQVATARMYVGRAYSEEFFFLLSSLST